MTTGSSSVATAPCPDRAAHKNGVPDDNHPDNLEWKTPVANNADKWRHGTDWNQTRKLVAEDVHEIREGLAADEPVASLAERFGVTAGTIRHIRRGHTWSHLPARPITGSYDRRPGQT